MIARLKTRYVAGTASVFLGSALILAACGGSGEEKVEPTNTPTAAETTEEATAASLPQAIADAGVIKVGTSTMIGMPWTAVDEATKENVGIDPDLARALGDYFGVNVEFIDLGFDSLIPSLDAGRIDLIISDMLDTEERQQAVDFVDYVLGADGMLVAPDSGVEPATINDICGYSVGVLRGAAAHNSVQQVVCEDGQEPDIQIFPDLNAELAAFNSGRLDIAMGDPSTWGYMATEEPDRYRSIGEIFNAGPIGIGVKKGESELATAVQTAINELIANGTYAAIFEPYGITEQAFVEQAEINGGA